MSFDFVHKLWVQYNHWPGGPHDLKDIGALQRPL